MKEKIREITLTNKGMLQFLNQTDFYKQIKL